MYDVIIVISNSTSDCHEHYYPLKPFYLSISIYLSIYLLITQVHNYMPMRFRPCCIKVAFERKSEKSKESP